MDEGGIDLSEWRQGDACLDVDSIPVLVGDSIPELESAGAVLISQTCDVVRSYAERSYVQVARLVEVDAETLAAVRKFQRPRYAYLPSLADRRLVADLDIVVTIDKRNVASWVRTPGTSSSYEQRELGYALGRHKSRFAFPDRWSRGLAKLRDWVVEKSKKNSEAGHFVRSVLQMRITADDVDSPPTAEIICIVGPEHDAGERDAWVKNILPTLPAKVDKAWCPDITFRIASTDELTVTEYMDGLRLDFDAITVAQG